MISCYPKSVWCRDIENIYWRRVPRGDPPQYQYRPGLTMVTANALMTYPSGDGEGSRSTLKEVMYWFSLMYSTSGSAWLGAPCISPQLLSAQFPGKLYSNWREWTRSLHLAWIADMRRSRAIVSGSSSHVVVGPAEPKNGAGMTITFFRGTERKVELNEVSASLLSGLTTTGVLWTEVIISDRLHRARKKLCCVETMMKRQPGRSWKEKGVNTYTWIRKFCPVSPDILTPSQVDRC